MIQVIITIAGDAAAEKPLAVNVGFRAGAPGTEQAVTADEKVTAAQFMSAVEGVQRVTKHVKAGQSSRGTRTGGIETVEAPIHVSNVMLVDPETKKGTRVGYRIEQVERDGRTRNMRVRVAKRSGKDI